METRAALEGDCQVCNHWVSSPDGVEGWQLGGHSAKSASHPTCSAPHRQPFLSFIMDEEQRRSWARCSVARTSRAQRNVDVVPESFIGSDPRAHNFWALFVRMLDRTCLCQCGPAVVAQHPQSYSVCAWKPCVCRAQCGKKVVLVVRLLSHLYMAVTSNFENSVSRVL